MDTDGPTHAQLSGVYLVTTLPEMTYQAFRALNIWFFFPFFITFYYFHCLFPPRTIVHYSVTTTTTNNNNNQCIY